MSKIDEIYIEKGSRIQYCSVCKIVDVDETNEIVKYQIIGENFQREASTYNFYRWYWIPDQKIIEKIVIERNKLTEELNRLDFLEKYLKSI